MLRELTTVLFGLFCLVAIFSLAFYLAPVEDRAATPLAEKTGDGRATASLTEAGVNVAAIRGGQYKNIHAILLVRGGRLTLKEYFQGYNREKPHPLRSAA